MLRARVEAAVHWARVDEVTGGAVGDLIALISHLAMGSMSAIGASHEARPRRERALRAGSDLVQRVLDVLPIGLALFDASADFRYLAGNPEFTRRLRLDRSPAIGRPARQVFAGAQRPQLLEAFLQARSAREPCSIFAPAAAAGAARVWNVDVFPVGAANATVSHLAVMVHETTERFAARERQEREATQLRERAEHLADVEKAKSEFLNLASHELRGPAATLRGYLSMLEDGTLGPLSEGLRHALPVLQAKASQINLLASEMVEAARLEDKEMRLHREPIDMRELLVRLVESAQVAAPNHRLVIEDRTAGPVVVSGDRLRLEIVINNLLDNAVKYSPAGGEVYGELSVTNGLLLIAVRDHGIGIASEDLPRLFVRFSRLATDQMPDVPGTGLGLYLARELARLHGGDIIAVSRLGEGSEFTLSLPVAAGPLSP